MSDPIVPAPDLSSRVGPVVPTLARRGDFMPTVGGYINISLPGEVVRATVEEIHSRDVLTVRLSGMVLGKSGGHTLRSGDVVAVERAVADGQLQEIWRPINEREVRMKEEAARLAADAVDRARPVPADAVVEIAEDILPEKPKRIIRRKQS